VIVIGELINGTRKAIAAAIAARDVDYLTSLACQQEEAGASYIDVNAGTGGDKEIDDLAWLVGIVQEVVSVPLSLDSPNPVALQRALDICKGPTPLINSITAEPDRIGALLPLVVSSGSSIIALCLSEKGMPSDADDRVNVGKGLVGKLLDAGIAANRIFIDPVVVPLGTDHRAGGWVLDAVAALHEAFPECHITGGLSNVSYGLPQRQLLNRIFVAMAIGRGLDSAIIDPMDKAMMATAVAAEALAERDEWCMNYLQAHRDGRLEA
jgi:cobalamin-dependent methionine synthase I